MRRKSAHTLLTPSKITAWLECPHYLSLTSRVDAGVLEKPTPTRGSFARLLADKGLLHERQCLAAYEAAGKTVYVVPDRRKGETFVSWIGRVGNPLASGYDVVYQMPFTHEGVQGIADFVERVAGPDGTYSYEPVDAKLTRTDAKPGHVLQLCFYADAIEALTGAAPEHLHILLGSSQRQTLRTKDFRPYWRRLRTQLEGSLDESLNADTVSRPCNHCPFCEFNTRCEAEWRAADSLTYVAGINQRDIDALVFAGTPTLSALAAGENPTGGLRPERWSRLVRQAQLQVQAKLQGKPPFEIIEPSDELVWGRGFVEMPAPDDGDVFLDFEGHPFWRPDVGLFFLFGLIEQTDPGTWDYRTWWAHSESEEAEAAAGLIDYLDRRRMIFPNMHVYHYNHTERSALARLAEHHGVEELALDELIRTGAFVDLYLVARNSVQVGTESYGLKHLERLTDFQRGHEIDQGAGAVVHYEQFMQNGNQSELDAIAAYNEDDVRATMSLRDWLVAQRFPDLEWRDAHTEPPPGLPTLDERVPLLHAYPAGSAEHFLGDLLGYWWREYFAYHAPIKVKLQTEPSELLEDPECVSMMRRVGEVERIGARGRPITPAMRFSFPQQALDRVPGAGGKVALPLPDDKWSTAEVHQIDRDAGLIDLVWSAKLRELDASPRSVVLYDWVDGTTKALALQSFTDDVLSGTAPHPVTTALLRRDLPKFHGSRPIHGNFVADLDDMCDWVRHLDHSYVAIQGPPGAGKTYTAAHLIHALVVAGNRVGITATSHHAIGNLLESVVSVFMQRGDVDRLRAVRKPGVGSAAIDHVRYVTDNAVCASGDFNLIAGTTWLFSSARMRTAPVDVLFIDEAGQMSLADALAASTAAHNLVLLGDPQQLPQVAQAFHPNESGVSVLDHVIADRATLDADRGVFLPETWRMHPAITGFISEQFYEGRLESHQSCGFQGTVEGTGLRWIRAVHNGCKTSSPDEAELIAQQIATLMGTTWTNQKGEASALGADDFMVVAPYNDQVRTIQERLAADDRLRDVAVGTVDKFQGREAAVVLFSMTTSSGADMTRSADFLFSRNRLNVAISRARCLAYLVCTEELLSTRARNVEDMRLIASLNAFVEYAIHQREH